MFLSDGRPSEALDGVFSFFAQRLAARPDAIFAPVAVGQDADGLLMSELARACRGPFLYLPDETTLSTELGHIWGMARTTVLASVNVILRPLSGCVIVETETPDQVAELGPTWAVEEVTMNAQAISQKLRCCVRFESEALASKACTFHGGGGDPVTLAARLADPSTPGRVVGRVGQRLLHVRRSNLNPKARKLGFEESEEGGSEGLDQRVPRRILVGSVSKGPIELEFEPVMWSEREGWSLEEEVITDEVIVSPGSRLMGYKTPGREKVHSVDAPFHHLGRLAAQAETLLELCSVAGMGEIILCFETRYAPRLIPVGNLQRGGSRQVLARVRGPPSATPAPGRVVEKWRPFVEALVVGLVVQPGVPPSPMRLRLGLSRHHVPSMFHHDKVPLRLCFTPTHGDVTANLGNFCTSLVDIIAHTSKEAKETLHAELAPDPDEVGIVVDLFIHGGAEVGRIISVLSSKDLLTSLSSSQARFISKVPPKIRGLAALRRLVQWRFATALQRAAVTGKWDDFKQLRSLCTGVLGRAMDPVQMQGSVLGAAAMDAAAVETNAELFAISKDLEHRLHCLSVAHGGQFSPAGALDALELFESKAVWVDRSAPLIVSTQAEFSERAALRENAPKPVADIEFAGAEKDTVSLRFRALGDNGPPITSYTLQVKDRWSGEVYRQSIRMSKDSKGFEEGKLYQASIPGLPSGRQFIAVVYAWNGHQGPRSAPVWCATPDSAVSLRPRPGRRATLIVGEVPEFRM